MNDRFFPASKPRAVAGRDQGPQHARRDRPDLVVRPVHRRPRGHGPGWPTATRAALRPDRAGDRPAGGRGIWSPRRCRAAGSSRTGCGSRSPPTTRRNGPGWSERWPRRPGTRPNCCPVRCPTIWRRSSRRPGCRSFRRPARTCRWTAAARTGVCPANTLQRSAICWPSRSTRTRSGSWRGAGGNATICSPICVPCARRHRRAVASQPRYAALGDRLDTLLRAGGADPALPSCRAPARRCFAPIAAGRGGGAGRSVGGIAATGIPADDTSGGRRPRSVSGCGLIRQRAY